ncbi:Coiled-coil domain-containing protein 25 [Desmophyllum pertusum]|uniref:Coiled-coil domain-containing protein 25 n=1 Tax=Desmophyllum pertusum TaxID=174260 RepID=A0A9W9Z4Z7_9CNID|nr:Coiled-coil domain-containing protein 25 [Desmophyllum pertusum]
MLSHLRTAFIWAQINTKVSVLPGIFKSPYVFCFLLIDHYHVTHVYYQVKEIYLLPHTDEELIKWGFPEDVWFHVDKLSSAHVYLRLRKGETLDDIPTAVLTDCIQLVKANSIQGNKMNNIAVVYTLWGNLKKTSDMEVGQVGFYSNKEVRIIKIEKRINEIVNRLNKTKEEKFPNLRDEREERDRLEREDGKQKLREQELRLFNGLKKDDVQQVQSLVRNRATQIQVGGFTMDGFRIIPPSRLVLPLLSF